MDLTLNVYSDIAGFHRHRGRRRDRRVLRSEAAGEADQPRRVRQLPADRGHGSVEFLDSTGLGVLVGGLKRVRAHEGWIDLVCTQSRILRIFRITGLNRVFNIYDTVAERRWPPTPRPTGDDGKLRSNQSPHPERTVGSPPGRHPAASPGARIPVLRRRRCAAPGPCAASGRTTSTCAGPARRARRCPSRPRAASGCR